jgi:hypothetical protein
LVEVVVKLATRAWALAQQDACSHTWHALPILGKDTNVTGSNGIPKIFSDLGVAVHVSLENPPALHIRPHNAILANLDGVFRDPNVRIATALRHNANDALHLSTVDLKPLFSNSF